MGRTTDRLAAVLGWLCLGALGVFIAMNTHGARVDLPGLSLRAPLAALLAIAAVLGAFGAHGLGRVLGWTRRVERPRLRDRLRAGVGWIAVAALVVFALMNLEATRVRAPTIELVAPMAAVVALAAVAGAFGHGGLRAVLRAVRRPRASAPVAAAPEAPAQVAEVEGAGASDAGRVRDHNEDSFLVDDDLRLYIVCDGMGGHAGGEVASALAVGAVRRVVAEGLPAVSSGAGAVELLRRGARAAAVEVHARAQAERGLRGMGCTLTALLVAETGAAMAHVGDTRLYRVRDGAAAQLSSDHTMVAGLIEAGLSEEEARAGAYAHTLTRCIGRDPEVEVDASEVELAAGDLMVLCSDGLTEYANKPEELAALIGDDVSTVPERLVAYANERGGQDNITVVAVRVPAVGARPVSATLPPISRV